MKITRLIGLAMVVILWNLVSSSLGQAAQTTTSNDYLNYTLPSDAVVRSTSGGELLDPPGTVENTYFTPGGQMLATDLIGREWYLNGKIFRRELYNGVNAYGVFIKHGVQREWYPSGQLKCEEPYKDGQMNGIFKYWDEQGNLVGQYTMEDGAGIERIYNSKGELIKVQEFERSLKNGFDMAKDEIGENINTFTLSLVWYKADQQVGNAFGFYATGAIRGVTPQTASGILSGPALDVTLDGKVGYVDWNLNNQHITKQDYEAAAAKDSSLPPYFSDATQYIDYFVTPEIKALFTRYKNLPLVKIPLEFDANGNPVLADGQPGADPAAITAPPPHYPPGYTAPATTPAVATAPKPAAPKPTAKPAPPIAQAESPSYMTPALVALGVLIVTGFFLRRRK